MFTCVRCNEELILSDEIDCGFCLECESRFQDIERRTDNWDIEPFDPLTVINDF